MVTSLRKPRRRSSRMSGTVELEERSYVTPPDGWSKWRSDPATSPVRPNEEGVAVWARSLGTAGLFAGPHQDPRQDQLRKPVGIEPRIRQLSPAKPAARS